MIAISGLRWNRRASFKVARDTHPGNRASMVFTRPLKHDPMAISSLLNDSSEEFSDQERRKRAPDHPTGNLQRAQSMQLPMTNNILTWAPSELYPMNNVALLETTDHFDDFDIQSPQSVRTARPSPSRPNRPKYTEEEMFFIWYHRTDLQQGWDQVLEQFIRQFPSRGKAGLQCKFYRLLDRWSVEKVRAQVKSPGDKPEDKIGKYGVVQRTRKRFSWMRPEHQCAPMLPEFEDAPSPRSRHLSE